MHCFRGLAAPQKSPVQPIWRTGEIFRLALRLATEDSDIVTGQSFTIDGGLEGNYGQRCRSLFRQPRTAMRSIEF
jgi:hypothetical protein